MRDTIRGLVLQMSPGKRSDALAIHHETSIFCSLATRSLWLTAAWNEDAGSIRGHCV